MSTIRRFGVAFHLIPTPDDGLWVEVIREADGAVLVSGEFDGDTDDDLVEAVDEWFDDLIARTVNGIDTESCRSCRTGRRTVEPDHHGRVPVEVLVEWEFDLCHDCAAQFIHENPWIQKYVESRYLRPADDD